MQHGDPVMVFDGGVVLGHVIESKNGMCKFEDPSEEIHEYSEEIVYAYNLDNLVAATKIDLPAKNKIMQKMNTANIKFKSKYRGQQ